MRERVLIHQADALEWLRSQPGDSFDAFFADPPYGLSPDGKARTWDDIAALREKSARGGGRRGFMGKAWDTGVPGPTFWREALRVLKPGAPILAFGGTRTYHRMVCAMEDAGAEIADCLVYLFARGFPKSYDVAKGLDRSSGVWRGRAKAVTSQSVSLSGPHYERTPKGGPVTAAAAGYGTALKPAYEPCVLAWKPFDGTIVDNWTKWGVGGLWIDGCRIGYASEEDKAAAAAAAAAQRMCHQSFWGIRENAPASVDDFVDKQDLGRWPANVLMDEEAAERLDEAVGDRRSGTAVLRNGGGGRIFNGAGPGIARPDAGYTDKGGPSRFFFVAKVSRWERDFGCEDLPVKESEEINGRDPESAGAKHARAGAGGAGGVRNHHPTLKAISATEYLARLVLPPARSVGTPRRLLVPFAGAGSEVIGAMRAGWDEVHAIEREDEYLPILRARVARWADAPAHLPVDEIREASKGGALDERQPGLFDLLGKDVA